MKNKNSLKKNLKLGFITSQYPNFHWEIHRKNKDKQYFNYTSSFKSKYFKILVDLQYRKSGDYKEEFYIIRMDINSIKKTNPKFLKMMDFNDDKHFYYTTFKSLDEFDKAKTYINKIIEKVRDLDQEYEDVDNLDQLNML